MPRTKNNKKIRLSTPFVLPEISQLVNDYSKNTGRSLSQIQNDALVHYKPIMVEYLKNAVAYEPENRGEPFVGKTADEQGERVQTSIDGDKPCRKSRTLRKKN